MKKNFSLRLCASAVLIAAALAFVAAPPAAQAQNATVYQLGNYNGGTNNVAHAATNTVSATIACSEFDNVGIQLTALGNIVGTNTTLLARFAKSVDSSNYETTPSIVAALNLTGTSNNTSFANASIPGVAGLKLVTLENTNATMDASNIVIKLRFKAPKQTTHN